MGLILLPPSPDKCQECAVAHVPEAPHNAHSLFYQTKFNMAHGRSATWVDAMAHCSDHIKQRWVEELGKLGVDVLAGQVYRIEAIEVKE